MEGRLSFPCGSRAGFRSGRDGLPTGAGASVPCWLRLDASDDDELDGAMDGKRTEGVYTAYEDGEGGGRDNEGEPDLDRDGGDCKFPPLAERITSCVLISDEGEDMERRNLARRARSSSGTG